MTISIIILFLAGAIVISSIFVLEYSFKWSIICLITGITLLILGITLVCNSSYIILNDSLNSSLTKYDIKNMTNCHYYKSDTIYVMNITYLKCDDGIISTNNERLIYYTKDEMIKDYYKLSSSCRKRDNNYNEKK